MDNTGKLGLFHILSGSSVASGIRRIEAVTGTGVLDRIRETQELLGRTAAAVKANGPEDLERRAVQLMGEIKELRRERDSLKSKMAGQQIEGAVQQGASGPGHQGDIRRLYRHGGGCRPLDVRPMPEHGAGRRGDRARRYG